MPPMSYIYWLLLILWVVLSPGYSFFASGEPNPRIVSGGNILLLVLFVLIGLQIFK